MFPAFVPEPLFSYISTGTLKHGSPTTDSFQLPWVENFAGKSGDWEARSKVQTVLRITVVEGVDTVVAMLPG